MLDVASGATRSRSVPWLLECFHLVWILHSLLVVARRVRLVILTYTLIVLVRAVEIRIVIRTYTLILLVRAVEIRIVIRTYTLILLVLLCLDIRILHIRNILVLRLHVWLMRSVVAIAKLLLIRVVGIRSSLRIVNISCLCSQVLLWW